MLIDLHADADVQAAVVLLAMVLRRRGPVLRAAVDLAQVDGQVAVLRFDRHAPAHGAHGRGFVAVGMLGRPVGGGRGPLPGRVVGRILGQHGEVSAWHGHLVVVGCLVRVAGVLVEELQERLVGLMVEVVDLVAAGE